MMEKAINRKIVWVFHMSMANGFIEKCGNIEIYINEILLEQKAAIRVW